MHIEVNGTSYRQRISQDLSTRSLLQPNIDMRKPVHFHHVNGEVERGSPASRNVGVG